MFTRSMRVVLDPQYEGLREFINNYHGDDEDAGMDSIMYLRTYDELLALISSPSSLFGFVRICVAHSLQHEFFTRIWSDMIAYKVFIFSIVYCDDDDTVLDVAHAVTEIGHTILHSITTVKARVWNFLAWDTREMHRVCNMYRTMVMTIEHDTHCVFNE